MDEEAMDVDTSGEFEYSNKTRNIQSVVSVPQSNKNVKISSIASSTKPEVEHLYNKSTLSKVENEKLTHLYKSFGIDKDDENISQNVRLNVIHMRGTENMETKDVFKYFEEYNPVSIEWINDISCNIVWLDNLSAAKALLEMSKKIELLEKESDVSNYDSDDEIINKIDYALNGEKKEIEPSINVKDLRCPLPPGIWRKGRDYKNVRSILLRFANKSDKKTNSEQSKDLLISRKRSHKNSQKVYEEKSNETKVAKKNPWGYLSENWGVHDSVEFDFIGNIPLKPMFPVRERIGRKSQKLEKPTEIILSDNSDSESSLEEEEWCKRSKIPRMRMYADDEEKKQKKIQTADPTIEKKRKKDNDLRSRITGVKKVPVYDNDIQVVVNNQKVMRIYDPSFDYIEDEEYEYTDSDANEILNHENFEEDEEIEEGDEEEGEIINGSHSEEEDVYEDQNTDDGTSSDEGEKEVQGAQGSVIKVVQHKPKLASTVSTVWDRLNNTSRSDRNSRSNERHHSSQDLRHNLKKNDLRSRIGNHIRGRSPLRIELRNDKYKGSDSE